MTTNDLRETAVPWGLLALLLVANVPLFLCMPLTDDTELFDLEARNLLDGGVLYRDVQEVNLPGVIWVQALVRWLLGNSSSVLRAVDLAFYSAVAAVVWCWLRADGMGQGGRAWVVLMLFLFYLSMSEWCHCQRDMWLLVPGLAGLTLRRRQIEACDSGRRTGWSLTRWAVVEGMVWGPGVWLKPMIVLPALGCWLVSLTQLRPWRCRWADLGGLLVGGAAVGGAGLVWLQTSGAWPYFFATLREWSPGYARGKEEWTLLRYLFMTVRFFPWQLLHLAAIPLALTAVIRTVRPCSRSLGRGVLGGSAFPLLAAFYLGWLAQAYLVQHLFDYVHAPGVVLAVAVVAGSLCPGPRVATAGATRRDDRPGVARRWAWSLAVAAFLIVSVSVTPAQRVPRLACWWSCVTQGSTPPLRDRLKLIEIPKWQDLERVAAFLRGVHARDGELTCYNSSLIHLYGLLELRPSTPFAYLDAYVSRFPARESHFQAVLAASPQRYVVSDVIASGVAGGRLDELCDEGLVRRPAQFPERLRRVFPWSEPVVFRAGPYLVHRVAGSPAAYQLHGARAAGRNATPGGAGRDEG